MKEEAREEAAGGGRIIRLDEARWREPLDCKISERVEEACSSVEGALVEVLGEFFPDAAWQCWRERKLARVADWVAAGVGEIF